MKACRAGEQEKTMKIMKTREKREEKREEKWERRRQKRSVIRVLIGRSVWCMVAFLMRLNQRSLVRWPVSHILSQFFQQVTASKARLLSNDSRATVSWRKFLRAFPTWNESFNLKISNDIYKKGQVFQWFQMILFNEIGWSSLKGSFGIRKFETNFFSIWMFRKVTIFVAPGIILTAIMVIIHKFHIKDSQSSHWIPVFQTRFLTLFFIKFSPKNFSLTFPLDPR